MGYLGHLLRFWVCGWNTHRLPYQVAAPRSFVRRSVALGGAMAFVVFFCSPIRAQQTAQDFTDVTIRTGAQLSGRLEQLIKGPNVRAAALYFGDQKANPSPAGL